MTSPASFAARAGRSTPAAASTLDIINNFNVGPTLVRGFAPGGIGPRDISDPDNLQAAGLGGTTYFGGTAEVQFPIFGLPREIGLKGAVFADAGTLFGYTGQTNFATLEGFAGRHALRSRQRAWTYAADQLHAGLLRAGVGRPHDSRFGRRKFDLVVAARPDPDRLRIPGRQG